MTDKQFDVSPEERRLFDEKVKQRHALREYYMKHITNPHRAEGSGYLFDPATFRFLSMRAKEYDYFRPTPVNGIYALLLVVVPFVGYTWLLHRNRGNKEAAYRSGQVAYRDRLFKLI